MLHHIFIYAARIILVINQLHHSQQNNASIPTHAPCYTTIAGKATCANIVRRRHNVYSVGEKLQPQITTTFFLHFLT